MRLELLPWPSVLLPCFWTFASWRARPSSLLVDLLMVGRTTRSSPPSSRPLLTAPTPILSLLRTTSSLSPLPPLSDALDRV
ncbi:hypothetical protein BCR35DRAFT_210539 [Leucosporidium creatinivorum]|uniref:Uncharacterized protein n=1 Tax=Leucosporidium creatinivorum TaxID=106004 RepID=A0A1Y2DDM8_9BASI|nr:hypothetical protein BCR35DRAFT_210539 [Leucosporidium creatinivorum]